MEVILVVVGMVFLCLLLFGGFVGFRCGFIFFKENGGECSVCGFVFCMGYLLVCDVIMWGICMSEDFIVCS